jgi:hypothetical protein
VVNFHLKLYSITFEENYKYYFEYKGSYKGTINSDLTFNALGTLEVGLEEWETRKWKTVTVKSELRGRLENELIYGDFFVPDDEDQTKMKPTDFGFVVSTESTVIPGNNKLGGSIPGWTVIVGSLLAATAIIAAVIKAMKAKKGKESKGQKEQVKTYHYILNLSKEEFSLAPNQSEMLTATVYKVDETGAMTQAEGAIITVLNPEPLLLINPAQGTTVLNASIALKGVASKESFDFKIRVQTTDNKLIEQPVRVTCGLKLVTDSEYPRELINGIPHFEVYYRKEVTQEVGEWDFKPIYIYFVHDTNTNEKLQPTAPPFNPEFSIIANPDILQFEAPVYQGNLVWKSNIKLKSGLEPDSRWLMEDGKITIEINAKKS